MLLYASLLKTGKSALGSSGKGPDNEIDTENGEREAPLFLTKSCCKVDTVVIEYSQGN